MNFAKRAVLSITRRLGKSLILFLVIFIIGNLIAGTVAVRQAITQSEEVAKRSLGAHVSLGLDDQALMEAYNRGEEPMIDNLSAALIEELGQRPEVRNFDYSLSAYLLSQTLENYQPPEEVGGVAMGATVAIGGSAEGGAYFSLRGTRYAPVMPIEEGKLSLVDGRVFTETDITEGRLVAIIPDVVAETNNLHVGDTITLVNEIRDYTQMEKSVDDPSAETNGRLVDSRDVILEVIGIFERNSGADDLTADGSDDQNQGGATGPRMIDFTQSELWSTIYVPIKVAQAEDEFSTEGYRKIAELAGEDWGVERYMPYYTPIYLLNSIDDLESFEQAASVALPEYYKVLSATSQYEQVAGPMKDIQQVLTVALIVVVIAALVVVSLVVVLFLRDRRKEFGIYLSLGARKPLIILQVLMEVLVVAIVALGVSLFTGYLVSDGLSQQMINNQIASAANNGYLSGVVVSGSFMGGDAGLLMGDLSLEDVTDAYRVSLSLPYVLTFLGLGIGVVVLSCVVPLLYVLRLKPKKILM
jgi:putative ABC transport system permease protein